MACIHCGFEEPNHDLTCPLAPKPPSFEPGPDPVPVVPSLTRDVEEALAAWRAASQMVDAIRAQQFELQAMYDKAYVARDQAAAALMAAMKLRDAGVDA